MLLAVATSGSEEGKKKLLGSCLPNSSPKGYQDLQGANITTVPVLGAAELLPVEAASGGVQHHRSKHCLLHPHTARGFCLPGKVGA